MRVLWILEELRLTYEVINLPFPPRAKCRPYLSQINPLGTVPTLIIDNLKMTESVAICMYLAQKKDDGKLCMGHDDEEYGKYLNWCIFGEATLTTALALIRRYSEIETDGRRQPQVVDDYKKWFIGRLKTLLPIIHKYPYICEYGFTVADISVGYALIAATETWWKVDVPDEIQRYVARLMSRPGYTRCKEREMEAAQHTVSWIA